jgi:hypothetical protein
MINLADRTTYPAISFQELKLRIDGRGLSEIQQGRLRACVNDRKEYETALRDFGKLVVIKITKFYKGRHYHLSSNQRDLEFLEKYDTFDDAVKHAMRYTSRRHIHFSDASHMYMNDGD